ncbi:hypothetical protein [Caloranaerobacter azorensis]|uniref:Uncharacterized protein n=1 Tax=Caloranaerobacter azorensis TaxID=116090 RepID=A0A6P1YFN3_9FIRM|nr:hypothetical protein [Caloranaerobacter azorensis]QIB27538.1 hypothetical protein G3A45_09710 [Caloranaerobacter azorensis]
MNRKKFYYSIFVIILTIFVVVIMLNLRVDIKNPDVYDKVDGKEDYAMKVYQTDENQNQAEKEPDREKSDWIKRTIINIRSKK